ncbi:MAG TPA: ABC transporter permease [Bryobacteraceae bacterium]|nr:ABC transporter permease [Bryobacteraceae bacterium]
MKQEKQPVADRLYGALLRLFPFDFRSDFGDDMEQTFREQRTEIERRKDRPGLLRLWWETIAGIFRTAPREHLAMLGQDTVYALRMMRKNKGYTVIALLVLALGIGANTAIVSVISTVLLRPLPYQNDGQLVVLHQSAKKAGAEDVGFSVPEIKDYRQQSGSYSSLVEYHNMRFTLFSKDSATRVQAGVVSPEFFGMFGVKPILGRDFVAADDQPSAPAVLLISYEYWKQHCSGDPDIVGRTFKMNDRVHTVIGVLPQVPQYPDENDVYMPTSACPFRSSKAMIANRQGHMMNLFGRLKPSVTPDHSRAELQLIATRMERDHPDAYGKGLGFTASSAMLRDELTHRARTTLLVLLAAAGCVLLIACANVANLTLARMSARERELTVRAALGAGKGRLLRQLVTESFILGILAAGLGVLLASQSLKLLVDFTGRLTSRAREVQVDGTMLLFALAMAILTSVVFGSISALYSREEISSGLRDGTSQTTAGRRRNRARSVLVVCQIAFSFVLLIGAGLMLRSFSKLQSVDGGFLANDRVLAANIDLNWSKYHEDAQRRDFMNQLLAKVQSQPGVLSVAISSSYPLDPDSANGSMFNRRFVVEGRIPREGESLPQAAMRSITPDYFQTLGIRIIGGRTFAESDNEKAPEVVMVNQTLARRLWGDEDPVGKRISFNRGEKWTKVIGVVGDVKEYGPERPAGDEIYLAAAQNPAPGALVVRTNREAMSLANQVRRAVMEVDAETAIPVVETLEQAHHDATQSPRVMTDLLGIFAALALVIAAAGIGGMLALAVNQRWHEIGIRIALGAKPGDVLGMVLRQGMGLVLGGLLFGLLASLALTRMMKTLLFEVEPTDPATFVGVSMVLAIAALIACYLPARRALKVDPLIALRRE